MVPSTGHTVSFVLCSLIWDRYFTGHRSRWPVYLYHFFVTTLGLISVIAARFHYTIDVVVAMIVTFTMWQRYHIFVDYRQLCEIVLRLHGDFFSQTSTLIM